MTDAQLERLWNRVRLRLLAIANGSTTSWDPKTSRGKAQARKPPTFHQELDSLERSFRNARSRKRKRELVWEALELVFYLSPPAAQKRAIQGFPERMRERFRKRALGQDLMRLRSAETIEWRVAVAREEGTVREVAALYGVPPSKVHRWRRELGVETNGAHRPTDMSRRTREFIRRQILELSHP